MSKRANPRINGQTKTARFRAVLGSGTGCRYGKTGLVREKRFGYGWSVRIWAFGGCSGRTGHLAGRTGKRFGYERFRFEYGWTVRAFSVRVRVDGTGQTVWVRFIRKSMVITFTKFSGAWLPHQTRFRTKPLQTSPTATLFPNCSNLVNTLQRQRFFSLDLSLVYV